MVAQGAHASLAATLKSLDDPRTKEWLAGPFKKICVQVDSEEALEAIVEKAESDGIIYARIIDAGLTEFGGVPTLTCAAFGPDTNEALEPLTGNLKLL